MGSSEKLYYLNLHFKHNSVYIKRYRPAGYIDLKYVSCGVIDLEV